MTQTCVVVSNGERAVAAGTPAVDMGALGAYPASPGRTGCGDEQRTDPGERIRRPIGPNGPGTLRTAAREDAEGAAGTLVWV